jgi:hypothetical protein
MKTPLLWSGALLLVVALVGCESPPDVTDDGDNTRLAEQVDFSLSEWLSLPRAELAALVKERMEIVVDQQERARSNPDSVDLLPTLRPSISPPIFQESNWSAKAGISLPPYLTVGAKDREVALHLARHGDHVGASFFADASDGDLKKRLEALKSDRNYPLEWTQLVALNQISAEFKLAGGDLDGAATLVHINRQLRQVLDAKAANGPIGAALLPRGRHALASTLAPLRDPKIGKKKLANDIEAALNDWSKMPTPTPLTELGTSRAELARIFRSEDRGRVLAAVGKEDNQRASDLLAIPLEHENVDGVVAFLDKNDRLSELFVYYFNTVAQNHPEPINLAQPLADAGVAGGPLVKQKGILRQTYTAGKLSYRVNIIQAATAGSTPAGAIVRIAETSDDFPPGSLPANPRDLGAVHLDRSFDANRIALDPSARPDRVVEVTRPDAVARVRQPVGKPQPVSVVLTREPDFNLVKSVGIRWSSDENKHALARLLLPLWSEYGSAKIDGVDNERGGCLAFTWEDAQTRYTMCLPYVDTQSPELLVTDRRGAEGLNARSNLTTNFDVDQRKARFAANKTLERLPRWLYLNPIHLGMTRKEALAALPKRDTLRVTDLPDGLNVLVLVDPPKDATHWAKQMFVRFTPGEQGRVAEIRVRYQEGLAAPTPEAPNLLDLLRKGTNGEPEPLAATWAEIWTDLPAKKFKPAMYRWQDDRTVMTYQRDAAGSEVSIRDCPLEYPLGQPLAPLQFCNRGLPSVKLGDDRAEVLKYWKIEKAQPSADGSLELGDPKGNTYDAATVWFENDKVSRIIARHRATAGLQRDEVAVRIQEFWAENLDQLGVIRRVDTLGTESAVSQRLASWGWHDDRTRVRCFGQDTEGGARLFTEWREWPVLSKP